MRLCDGSNSLTLVAIDAMVRKSVAPKRGWAGPIHRSPDLAGNGFLVDHVIAEANGHCTTALEER
jgi:hypothetical protein